MKGRHPKPRMIRELEGNRRKTPLPNNPIPIGEPVCNADLSPDEQRFWFAVIDAMPVGLLTRADEQALERMAVAWSRFWDCRKKIAATGLIVKGANGPIKNPLLIVERDAREEMHRAGEILGLSPVARARITSSEGLNGEDPLDVLLNGVDSGAWDTQIVPFPGQHERPAPKKRA